MFRIERFKEGSEIILDAFNPSKIMVDENDELLFVLSLQNKQMLKINKNYKIISY